MPSFFHSHSQSQPTSPIERGHDRISSSESHSDKLSALPDLLLRSSPSLNSSPRLRNQVLLPHSHSSSQSQSHVHGHGLFATSNSEPELPTHTHTPNHSPRQNLTRLSIDSAGSLPSIQRVFTSTNARKPAPGTRGEGVEGHAENISRSRSHSFSRPTSPLRLIHQWATQRHPRGEVEEEDPFVPVNPFKWRGRFLGLVPTPADDVEAQNQTKVTAQDETEKGDGATETTCNDALSPLFSFLRLTPSNQPATPNSSSSTSSSSTMSRIFGPETRLFLTDILPRQIYLHVHLRLPALYFSRVARIFEDAEVSRPDVQRMIDVRRHDPPQNKNDGANEGVGAAIGSATNTGVGGLGGGLDDDDDEQLLPYPEYWQPPHVSPALARFKQSWEVFIDTLIREWKTLNVVSALLLSAITTMFQVPQAAEDTVTRTAALISLICALMSLSYGCVYIVRFGGMRSMVRASRWAEEARRSHTAILWNVWILLATPAVWLAWSMVGFIVCILSFVWRSNWHPQSEDTEPSAHDHKAVESDTLLPQILVSAIFTLGLVYFGLIVHTLAGYSYGSGHGKGKRRWQKIVHSMSNDGVHEHVQHLEENRGRARRDSREQGRQSKKSSRESKRQREKQEKKGKMNGLAAGESVV